MLEKIDDVRLLSDITLCKVWAVRGINYTVSSNINRTFIIHRSILILIRIFLNILLASLCNVAIALAVPLYPFQESLWLLVQPSLHKNFNFIVGSKCFPF